MMNMKEVREIGQSIEETCRTLLHINDGELRKISTDLPEFEVRFQEYLRELPGAEKGDTIVAEVMDAEVMALHKTLWIMGTLIRASNSLIRADQDLGMGSIPCPCGCGKKLSEEGFLTGMATKRLKKWMDALTGVYWLMIYERYSFHGENVKICRGGAIAKAAPRIGERPHPPSS